MIEFRQYNSALEQQVGQAPLLAMDNLHIDDVLSTVERGAENLPSYMDLYRKSVKQAWNPDELDFSQDRAEWQSLTEAARRRRVWSMRLFFDGEERVASLLAPLAWAAPKKEVEAFVATQLTDEFRHTVFFERYWREVVGTRARTLDELIAEIGIRGAESEAYDRVFYRWLPEQAQWLASHPSDMDATLRFVTLYHLVVEGARRWGRTWGFYKGFVAATRDESRHVLFGVKYLQDRVREDPRRFVPIIRAAVEEALPMIGDIMQPPGGDMTYYGGPNLAQAWPGHTPQSLQQEMIAYARSALGRRLHAVGIPMPAVRSEALVQ